MLCFQVWIKKEVRKQTKLEEEQKDAVKIHQPNK
jgi:hypothetical protein